MMDAHHIDEQAAGWLARQDRGEWAPSDQVALDDWLDQSTAHRTAYLRLAAAWQRADRLAELAGVEPRRRWPVWPAAIAACLVAMLAGTAWLLSTAPAAVHATALGGYEEVRLGDGSHVALNTDTRLLTVIDRGTREVWLDRGEAYFDVAHDKTRPFVVHAGKQVITVLGTRFSVRMDHGHVKVTVAEGRVKIDGDAAAAARPTLLTHGEVATVTDSGLLVTTETAEQLKDELAWRQGWLIFDDTTLAEAAAEFNRYSNRKLVIADPATGAIRIGGRFATGNVEGFARLMQTGLNLKITYRADAILISG